MGLLKKLSSERGSSVLEALLYVLIAAGLVLMAVFALVKYKAESDDFVAQSGLYTTGKISTASYSHNSAILPTENELISLMSSELNDYTFLPYNNGENLSDDSRTITVNRDNDNQVTLCSKSLSELVFCLRHNYAGMLSTQIAAVPEEGDLFASINPAQLLFPENATAASRYGDETSRISRCVGLDEVATRECLSTTVLVARVVEDSNPGWEHGVVTLPETGDPVVPDPEPDPEPNPEPDPEPEPEPEPELPRDYAAAIAASGPSASCPFDETGNAYVNLQCTGINGQLQDQSPRFTTQQAGALLSNPDSRAVSFNGATHYSYGNPSNASTNNQGSNWSVGIWVKPNNSASNQAIVSADDNWVLRFAGSNGFACGMRLGYPWSVETIQGGAPSVAGQWYYVVCTYEAGALRLYVNGELVAGKTGVPVGQSGNGNFRPGYVSHSWTGGSHLNGTIDQFNFYKKTLTAEEIAGHYYAAGY